MGRKGGGKKAFLKGVVSKPEADDVPLDQGLVEAGAESAQPTTSEPAAKHSETVSPGLQLLDVSSAAEDISSESRGQLTQRHKKVGRWASVIPDCLLFETDTTNAVRALQPFDSVTGSKAAERSVKEIRQKEEGKKHA